MPYNLIILSYENSRAITLRDLLRTLVGEKPCLLTCSINIRGAESSGGEKGTGTVVYFMCDDVETVKAKKKARARPEL